MLHQLNVQSRRIQPRARGHDHMRNPAPLLFAQAPACPPRNASASARIARTPPCGALCQGTAPRHTALPHPSTRRSPSAYRIDEGIAMLNRRHPRHAAEKIAHRALGYQAVGKIDERPMHIVRGNGRRNTVDVSCCHRCSPRSRTSLSPQSFLDTTIPAICHPNVSAPSVGMRRIRPFYTGALGDRSSSLGWFKPLPHNPPDSRTACNWS